MTGLRLSDLNSELFGKIIDEYDRIFKAWSRVSLKMLRVTFMDDIKESFHSGMNPGFRLGSVKFFTEDSKLFVRRHTSCANDGEAIVYFEFYVNSSYAEKKYAKKLAKAERDFDEAVANILFRAGVAIDLVA